MNEHIVIERRYCGPPESGNGGYTCGRLAGYVDGTAEVTLKRPPPLERTLKVERQDGGSVRLADGQETIAEAIGIEFSLDVVESPSFADAQIASKSFTGFDVHPFPTCFVCGPERKEGEGLRIFPGAFGAAKIVAAPWIPDASLTGDNGMVRPEFIWAALDCPGGFAVRATMTRPIVLGRMAAKLLEAIRPGEKCVVVGWRISVEGRKYQAGTALFSEPGALVGMAKSTWISLET